MWIEEAMPRRQNQHVRGRVAAKVRAIGPVHDALIEVDSASWPIQLRARAGEQQ